MLFSFFLNLLQLTPTLYMLQLSERVLSSRDETTLIALSVMVLFLYVISSILEWARSHLLVRLGLRLDEALNDRVFEAAFKNTLSRNTGNSLQPLHDLAQVRQFLAGPGLLAFFDAPWTVIFLAVIFLLHPLLGAISLAGAVLLLAMTLLTERLTQKPLAEANAAWARTSAFASNSLRNVEVISAMGMLDAVRERWLEHYDAVLGLQALASDRAGSIGAATRLIRIGLQSLILGTGAWLAINGHLSAGGMFAGSILMGRMLSPVELCIANWKGFVLARGAYARLSDLLKASPPPARNDGASRSHRRRPSRESRGGRARVQGRHPARRELRGGRRRGGGHHRTERVGQIDAGARFSRRLARLLREGAPRRRRHIRVGQAGAGAPCRLPAAGHRALQRHHRREHRPLRHAGLRESDRSRQAGRPP